MSQSVAINRALLAWMAIGCLVTALLLTFWDHKQFDGTGGILLRISIVLGAMWLFVPQKLVHSTKARVPISWVLLALAATVILARVRVPIIYFVVTVGACFLILWMVKPRPRNQG